MRRTNHYGFVRVGTLGQPKFAHVGVLKGESATLHCEGRCEDITWSLNSDIIVESGQLVDNDTERFNFSCKNCQTRTPVCKLTILEAEIEDSGEYLCYDNDHDYYDIYDYFWYTRDLYYSRVTVIRKLCVTFINLH